MKAVITAKNKLESIYKKFPRLVGYAGKLVFTLISLFLLRSNCGYNELLSNAWTVVLISIFCAFAPARFLVLILLVYALVQFYTLSLGVGVICTAIIMAVYLIYFRFDTSYVYLVFLIPVLSMARLPLLLVLILAVTGSFDMLILIIFGNLIYYMIRYVNLNAAVISGMTDQSEYAKMTLAAKGIFTNTEFLYTVVIFIVVFLLVHYMKKININQANNLSIAAGSGMYIILSLIANLIFETLTVNRLINIIVGAVIAALAAAIIVYAVLPLDYTRLETFEFEDDEYHYYVRAIPKVVISRESVRVKKINTRKEINTGKAKEKEH